MMKRMILLLAVSAALVGCEPDDIQTVMAPAGDAVGYAEVPVALDFVAGGPQTKAPLLSGADDAQRGGVLFLVYRSATGRLDSHRFFTPAELAGAASRPLTLRLPLVECDVYVLGNLLAVSRQDPSVTANLLEALGSASPADEAELEAMAYRLDGGAINAAWRRETMAEVAQYGIPFSCVDRKVPVASLLSAGLSVPQERPSWMFSRVEVTVDHGLFDGGDPAKVGYFTNRTLKMKQANLRLLPFSAAGTKALSAADVGDGDLDPAMTNGTSNTYVFFVPENRQGTAPEAAFAAAPDAAGKSRLKVPSNTLIPAACRDFGTYVEFKGTLDKHAGGFGGDVTYQFYLGANETTDFNLLRGRRYRIRLCFSADGLFHPDWRVQPDLSDDRLFRLTADPSFSTDIGDVNASRTLAVRTNRVGALYVYMNPGGRLGGTNLLLGKEVRPPAEFAMTDLSDCAWYGAFMTAGTEEAEWLAARGIRPAWDREAARLSFSVTDAAKFRAHLGESRTLALTLLPGGTVTASFSVRLFPDLSLSVAEGKSLTDEFYLGQKRTVTVSGFAGQDIRYAAVQEGCGATSDARKTLNVQWKATDSDLAPFPSCAVDAAGRVVLDVSDRAYASQRCSGRLDVYAFYPNRFLASHSGWQSRNGKIVFFSEDYLNDSLEAAVRISEPRLSLWKPTGKSGPWYSSSSASGWSGAPVVMVNNGSQYAPVILNIDGTEMPLGTGIYFSFDASSRLPDTSFDPVLYERLLKISVSRGTPVPGKEWLLDAVKTDGRSCIYIGDTIPAGHPLENEALDRYSEGQYTAWSKDQVTLGCLSLRGNPATGLYDRSSEFWVAATRMSDVTLSKDDSCFAWEPYRNGTLISRYFLLMDSQDGRNTERMALNVSASFRGGDVSRLRYEQTGPKVTFTVGSHVIEPVYGYERRDETNFKWIYDASSQVKEYAGQTVPGELLVPYGEQRFTFSYTNKWDHRTFTASSSVKILYDITLYSLYAFSTTAGKVFVVPHRNADLLARKGASMSHAAREFCLQALGVNFGKYFYANPARGYDYGYAAAPSDAYRGAYSPSSPYAVETTFNGAAIPMKLYRSRLTSWTENASRDFCWATHTGMGGNMTWRYTLNSGGLGWMKDAYHNPVTYPEAKNIGYDDRFNHIVSSCITSYLSGKARHNASYARTFSSADEGHVDILRYYLWLGNQPW